MHLDAVSSSAMRGACVQLDRSHTGRRNLLLAGLPAGDFALLAPHLKDVVLEQGTVLLEQGEPIAGVVDRQRGY